MKDCSKVNGNDLLWNPSTEPSFFLFILFICIKVIQPKSCLINLSFTLNGSLQDPIVRTYPTRGEIFNLYWLQNFNFILFFCSLSINIKKYTNKWLLHESSTTRVWRFGVLYMMQLFFLLKPWQVSWFYVTMESDILTWPFHLTVCPKMPSSAKNTEVGLRSKRVKYIYIYIWKCVIYATLLTCRKEIKLNKT